MRNRNFNAAAVTPPADVTNLLSNLVSALGMPAGTVLNNAGIGKGVWTGIRTALMKTTSPNPNCDYIQISFGATVANINDPNFRIVAIIEGMYQGVLDVVANEYPNPTSQGSQYASERPGGGGGGNGMLAVPPPTP